MGGLCEGLNYKLYFIIYFHKYILSYKLTEFESHSATVLQGKALCNLGLGQTKYGSEDV